MFFVTVNDSTEVDAAGQVSGTQVGGGSLTELTSFLLSLGVTDAVTIDAGASTQQWAYQSPSWTRVDNLEPMIAVHASQVGKPVTDAFLISGHVVEMPT
jgi:hypothetical protein